MIKFIKKWFKKKVIVHSRTHMPAVFIKHIRNRQGKQYVRVKFTNRIKYQGNVPLTDIPHSEVLYIRVLAPLFVEKLCRHFGLDVPQKKIYYDQKLKRKNEQQSDTPQIRKA
jgi:hypothetical protein